jgi:Polyphosphate kinase 2 (PPK2)
MLERTHIPEARWWVVEGVDKKKARLNCIHHLLQQVPYEDVEPTRAAKSMKSVLSECGIAVKCSIRHRRIVVSGHRQSSPPPGCFWPSEREGGEADSRS